MAEGLEYCKPVAGIVEEDGQEGPGLIVSRFSKPHILKVRGDAPHTKVV